MDVLVLGGTQFVGRHIVEALVATGHRVSILTRGITPDELPTSVERLRGDRDNGLEGLAPLAGRSWQVCIDVSGYTPRQVQVSAKLLRDRVGRYVFISAVRTYGDPQHSPVDEDYPTVPPAASDVVEIDNDTYGPLKVACENTVRDIYGEQATILRPQIVVGPHDPSGRYTHWIQRAALGGEMLAPGDGSDYLQVIDARDLARFVVSVVECPLFGTFNLAGLRITWAEFIELLGVENPIWVPADLLKDLSPQELPLYRPAGGPYSSLMNVSFERARTVGLSLSNPAATLRDVREWCTGLSLPSGLTLEQEKSLIQQAKARI